MISNLFPGLISPFSPYLAFFTRAVGTGLADNYVRGQTVAEMFGIPTTHPVYLTVVVPSNCYVYDFYGLHEGSGLYTYSPGPGGVGALRLDDLHEDSIVLIINNGEISGAGGDGGMGYQGYHWIGGQSTVTVAVGSGGGGGRGRAGTTGGMKGYGSDWPYYMRYWVEGFEQEPGIPSPYLSLDGGDGDEDGPGLAGGTRDTWSYGISGEWVGTNSSWTPMYANLAAYEEAYIAYSTTRSDLQHERGDSSKYGWFLRDEYIWTDEVPRAVDAFSEMFKANFTAFFIPLITPEIPGYDVSHKAIYVPQPGTAAIVLGCKTYIHNSEASGKEGYIYGGGGGGVGGDRGAGTGLGFDGGDWGEQGEGPNYEGHDGGLGGKAVELNGNDLTWLAGELQIEGDVS